MPFDFITTKAETHSSEVFAAMKKAATSLVKAGGVDMLPAIEAAQKGDFSSTEALEIWIFVNQSARALAAAEYEAELPPGCTWEARVSAVRTFHPNAFLSRHIRAGLRNVARFKEDDGLVGVCYDFLQADVLRRHDLPSVVRARMDSHQNSGTALWECDTPMADWLLEGDGQTPRVLNAATTLDVCQADRVFTLGRCLELLREVKGEHQHLQDFALKLEATKRGLSLEFGHPFLKSRLQKWGKADLLKGGNPNGARSVEELANEAQKLADEFADKQLISQPLLTIAKRLRVHGISHTRTHIRFPAKLMRQLAGELSSRMGVAGQGFKALANGDSKLPDLEVLETLEEGPKWLLECFLAYAHGHRQSGGFEVLIVSNTESDEDFWVARWLTNIVGLGHLKVALLMEDDAALAKAGNFAEAFKDRHDYISMFAYSDTSRGSSYTAGFLLWHAVQETVKRGEGKVPLYFGWSAIGFGEPLRGSHTVLPDLGDTKELWQTVQGQNFTYFALTGAKLCENLAKSRIPVSKDDPVGQDPELLRALLKWHENSAKAFQGWVFSASFRSVLNHTMIGDTGKILHSLRATAKSDGAGTEVSQIAWDKTRAINTVVTGCLVGMPFQLYGVASGWKALSKEEKQLIQNGFAKSPFLTKWLDGLMIALSRVNHEIFEGYCQIADQKEVAKQAKTEIRALRTMIGKFPGGNRKLHENEVSDTTRELLFDIVAKHMGRFPELCKSGVEGSHEDPDHRRALVLAVATLSALGTFG